MTIGRRNEEGPLPLKEAVTLTITIGMRSEDRTQLESLGLLFADGPEGAITLTIPGGEGIISLPSNIVDETLNEEKTRVTAHTLMRYFRVGAVLLCVSTRFFLPLEGEVQPQWTTLSVLKVEAPV